MSHGHMHLGGAGMTQNQGNVLGDRPCVRQSKLYREQCGGNTMKELMGQESLKWDTNRTEGAYQGGRVFDHNSRNFQQAPPPQQQQQQYYSQQPPQQQQYFAPPQQQQQQQQQQYYAQPAPAAPQQSSQVPWATSSNNPQQQQPAPQGHRKGAGQANKQTYNILTGE